MSYVVTKLSPGIAYRHGHWPWVQFINIDVGQADHDCPRRGGGGGQESITFGRPYDLNPLQGRSPDDFDGGLPHHLPYGTTKRF